MSHAIEPDSNTSPKPRLVDAYDVKRRPRPPGSSWLLDPDLDLRTLTYRLLRQRARLISDAKRPADAPVRSRKVFTMQQKKAVCVMAARTELSTEALAKVFQTNRKTIARTLLLKQKWMNYDLTKTTTVARDRRPTFLTIEVSLMSWAWKCNDEGVLLTDERIKAKAMEIAKESSLLDPPKPFACSPKWLRKVKKYLRIVNGKIVDLEETSPPSRDEPSGSGSPGLRSPVPEPSEASQETCSSQPSVDADVIAISSASSPPIPFRSAPVRPRADTYSSQPALPPTFASSAQGSTDTLPIGVKDTSSLSMVEHALPSQSYQTPSPQAPPELYSPDWLSMLELVAPVGQYQYEKYDGMGDAPASDLQFQLGSALPTDMSKSILLSDGLHGVPPIIDVQTSRPSLMVGGSGGPVPFVPPDYSVRVATTDGVSTDVMPFFSPFPDDAGEPSSFIWPTNASPTLTSSVDVSAPSVLPMDPFGIFPPQLAGVPQEDIDRLAAEMMHWPIEDLLDGIAVPMSQSHAAHPCGEFLFNDVPVSFDWPCVPLDGFGDTDFVSASI